MLKLENSGVYQIYIYHNYVYSRNYHIKVNDMNLTSSKKDILLEQYVKIFPNPVKMGEELNINIYSMDLIKGNMSIYSNNGQEIFRSTSWQPKIKMDRLTRGVYFLKLNLKGGGFITKKIVVD